MRSSLAAACAALLALLLWPGIPTAQGDAVDAFIRAQMQEQRIPGMSLAVVVRRADGRPWTQFIDERIFKPSGMHATYPITLNDGTTYPYGFGWQIGSFRGRRVVFHGGGGPGIATHFARYIDDRVTIVLLINLGDVDKDVILDGVARLFLTPSSTPALPASSARLIMTRAV